MDISGVPVEDICGIVVEGEVVSVAVGDPATEPLARQQTSTVCIKVNGAVTLNQKELFYLVIRRYIFQ